MIPNIGRLLLLLFVVSGAVESRRFARRSMRIFNLNDYRPGLFDSFRDRSRHRPLSLPHSVVFGPKRHRAPEYHNEKKLGKLAGPENENEKFEVCFEDDNGLPCNCTVEKGVMDIDCSDETLRTAYIYPSIKNAKVERVDMEGNAISELWPDRIVPEHESTLKVLILRKNNIYFIKEGAFTKMTELVTLDLSYNRLGHLPRKTFGGGQGLEWKLKNLYLDNNQLEKIEDYAFEDLTFLEKIVLDENHGLNLTDNTFGKLANLKELSLDGCDLKSLPPKIFEHLLKLEFLSIRENPLSFIPPAVKAVKSLMALDISATFIEEITPDALSGDYKLEKLIARDLAFVWAIEKCAFCGLPNLKEVIFYNCSQLYVVHEEAFGNETFRKDNSQKIELLDFEKCNISTLPNNLVDWSHVKTLKLGDNPFHCDCKLGWMTELEVDLSDGDSSPSCASPPHLEGRPLKALRKREICQGSFRFGRLFVGLTLILLVSVGLIVGWYVCTTRGRDGNGLRIRNIFYKPQLPRYGYRNLVVKEDEQSLANEDFNDHPAEIHRSKLPSPVEV